jgi:hypothetical protein
VFTSENDAIFYEHDLIKTRNVIDDDKYYNKVNHVPTFTINCIKKIGKVTHHRTFLKMMNFVESNLNH